MPPSNDATKLLLGAGLAVGLFMLGKAGVDHVLAKRGPVTQAVPEPTVRVLESKPKRVADDLVALAVVVFGSYMSARSTIEAVDQILKQEGIQLP